MTLAKSNGRKKTSHRLSPVAGFELRKLQQSVKLD
jgi:hypothetical protein